jgi:hypothetical protein
MDPDNRIIPIVGDDQGEGFTNEIPPKEMEMTWAEYKKTVAEHGFQDAYNDNCKDS